MYIRCINDSDKSSYDSIIFDTDYIQCVTVMKKLGYTVEVVSEEEFYDRFFNRKNKKYIQEVLFWEVNMTYDKAVDLCTKIGDIIFEKKRSEMIRIEKEIFGSTDGTKIEKAIFSSFKEIYYIRKNNIEAISKYFGLEWLWLEKQDK